MSGKENIKLSVLEESLVRALQAIDNQIAREMQRAPEKLEVHGVQKWEPYQSRIEGIAAFLIDQINGGEIQLDSLIVMSQAVVKGMEIVLSDLGEDGLGKVRANYCRAAMEFIATTAESAKQQLGVRREIM